LKQGGLIAAASSAAVAAASDAPSADGGAKSLEQRAIDALNAEGDEGIGGDGSGVAAAKVSTATIPMAGSSNVPVTSEELGKTSQLLAAVQRTNEILRTDAQGNVLDESQRLKRDIDLRPVEMSTSDSGYARVPIDDFGSALLRGMGWTPGGKVGLSNAARVEPFEASARPQKLGLGAQLKPWMEKKRGTRRPGDITREREKRAEGPSGPRAGGFALIVAGPYEGWYGPVTSLRGRKAVMLLEGKRERPDGAPQSAVVSRGEFSVCTVTFHANLAHSLTRSP
jgi:hypothetical protein